MTNNSIQLTKEVFFGDAPENWNENLLKSSNSTIFQTSNWADIYKNTFNSKPIFIIIKNKKNEVVGQLACLIHNDYYWNKKNLLFSVLKTKFGLGSILKWKYGPIIHDKKNSDKITNEILNAIDDICSKEKIILITGSSPALDDSISNKVFSEKNYVQKNWGTYVIKLDQHPDEYFKKLDKDTRYDIRKAEKQGVHNKISDGNKSLEDFVKLKRGIDFDDKLIPNTKDTKYFESHTKFLQEKDMEKIFFAKTNDSIIAGIRTIFFNNYAVQHSVVSPNSNKTLQGGSFLTWSAIKWAMENHFKYYDMGGINPNPSSKKEEGINFYKSKWGGEKIIYTTYSKLVKKSQYTIAKTIADPSIISGKLVSIIKKL